jgi:hypothetical protein
MAQSVCSFQPAIAIIPWKKKPSDSVTTFKKYWLIFVLEGGYIFGEAGSHALFIDFIVGLHDLAVVAV